MENRPYSSRPSCDGRKMSSGWTIMACPVNCCMESLRLARKSKAAWPSSTRTLWRKTFRGVGNELKEIEAAASDRSHWHSLTHTASKNFEDDHCQGLMAACERHHSASSADITIMEFQCPTCFRCCPYWLGLQSHQRIHRWSYSTTCSLLWKRRTTTNHHQYKIKCWQATKSKIRFLILSFSSKADFHLENLTYTEIFFTTRYWG